MDVCKSTHRTRKVVLVLFATLMGFGLPASIAEAGAPDSTSPDVTIDDDPAPFEEPDAPPGTGAETTTVPSTVGQVPAEAPDDGSSDGGDGAGEVVITRRPAAPSVRDSGIPVSSIVIAVAVLLAVGGAAVLLARRPEPKRRGQTKANVPAGRPPSPEVGGTELSDVATLPFLLELGQALIDTGDAVGHIEAMLRKIAAVHGISELGVVVLPSVLMLSAERDEVVRTELRTGAGAALRLDQIDDVLRLELASENGEISVDEGRRELARIRASPPPFRTTLVLLGYVAASVGLAMILRGAWLEMALAAVLGLVVGAFRMATFARQAAYQAFWPLIAAAAASASVFAVARVVDDLAVFPALIAPLIFFLPGGLLTIGVLELATGQTLSGASRVAAGAMQLVLLAIGILAGARLVGVPGGDIRAGDVGVVAVLEPWIGVAVFGVGVVWFYGARTATLGWILLVMYVSYSGQVIGGLFFGSALSAFFGAVAMTPVALYVARQRSGPTPLVTFLPGFWMLVPGALGLEGVTRIIGDDGNIGFDVLVTSVISMVGISLGVLLGLVLTGADPSRPWSIARRVAPQ